MVQPDKERLSCCQDSPDKRHAGLVVLVMKKSTCGSASLADGKGAGVHTQGTGPGRERERERDYICASQSG